MTSTVLAATWFFIGVAVANIGWAIVFFKHNKKLRKIMGETQELQNGYATAIRHINAQVHAECYPLTKGPVQ